MNNLHITVSDIRIINTSKNHNTFIDMYLYWRICLKKLVVQN